MKTPKTKTIFLISAAALCILTSVAGVLVYESRLPYMTKYSFIMISAAGLCALISVLLNACERITEQLSGNLLKAKETELQSAQKELSELKRQNEELKTMCSAPKPCGVRPENAETDSDILRRKCETLEKFRSSFPYRIADGYILYNIIRTEIQVSSFSRWQIVGEYNGQLWECTMLRPDTQAYKEMLCLAAATTDPSELEELNISGQLLWN